jgi:hypothetical protein
MPGMLTFPPLVSKWTVKSEASWPGAEFTRRTKLKVHCEEEYSAEFLDEMRTMLGELKFQHYQEALRPAVSKRMQRGRPPAEGMTGAKPIQPSAKLARAGGELSQTFSGSTKTISGHTSRSRVLETTKTQWGDVPSHMFDNKPVETVDSLDEWFLTYGRPTPGSLELGPSNMYTVYQPLGKRICGNPSLQQRMKKGVITR